MGRPRLEPVEQTKTWDVNQDRAAQRARQAAHRRLAATHHEEYRLLFHEEQHRENLSHRHNPAFPETVSWWGEDGPES